MRRCKNSLSVVFTGAAVVLAVVLAVAGVSSALAADDNSIGPAEPAAIAPSGERVVRAPEPDADGSPSVAAAVSWESVAASMQAAQTMLAAGDAGEITQERQREVLAGLDAMIAAAQAALRRQPGQPPLQPDWASNTGGDSTGTGGDAANPNAVESVERHGTENVEHPDAAGPRRTAAEEFWGRLPERVRQRVLQSAETRAVPKYREAVEEYFQRLLESREAIDSARRD